MGQPRPAQEGEGVFNVLMVDFVFEGEMSAWAQNPLPSSLTQTQSSLPSVEGDR